MDLYRFIDSKDVSKYLRTINYQFSTPEAAYVVFSSCTATLKEKFEAFAEIIKTMPDCKYEHKYVAQYDSFHRFLLDYMQLQCRKIKLFKQQEKESDAIFTFEIRKNKALMEIGRRLFDSFECCFEFVMNNYKDVDYDEFIIKKKRVEHHDNYCTMEMSLNNQGEILTVDIPIPHEPDFTLDISFEQMWFDIPTPFQRGDILKYNPHNYCSQIFVLDRMDNWDSKKHIEQGVKYVDAKNVDRRLKRLAEKGDISEMGAIGVTVDENGLFDVDHFFNYLAMEKVTEPLEGKWKLLNLISRYCKHEYNEIDLLNLQQIILTENHLKILNENIRCSGRYDDIAVIKS